MILGYHGIADVEPRHDPVRLFVPPSRLRAQIRRLQRRGYRFLSMAELAEELASGAPLDRTCALTFDDGTEDHLTRLRPLLEELGVPGTVYVCPGLFGEPYPWATRRRGVRFMTEAETLELASHPLVEIGVAHDRPRRPRRRLGRGGVPRDGDLQADASSSSSGRPVPSFCYPRCVYSPACPGAARRAGYTSAVTCGPRGSWDPFELKRESMHTPDGRVTFELKSRGVYYGLRTTPPARLARWATRGYRHRSEHG